jgi:hypothetical protein
MKLEQDDQLNDSIEAILNDMIEIEPLEQAAFFVVRETLTRLGVPSRKHDKPKLFQSVHIFHKKGRYFLAHFKHLFLLDGKFEQTHIEDEDLERLYIIAKLMTEWNLIKPLNKIPEVHNTIKLTIIPHSEKDQWVLSAKHRIGNKTKHFD